MAIPGENQIGMIFFFVFFLFVCFKLIALTAVFLTTENGLLCLKLASASDVGEYQACWSVLIGVLISAAFSFRHLNFF